MKTPPIFDSLRPRIPLPPISTAFIAHPLWIQTDQRQAQSSTTRDTSSITSSGSSSSSSPTDIYTSVTTVTGEVRTVVITPSPTATAEGTLGQSDAGDGGGGVNTGKVVGIVLGVVLGISALIGLAVWLWFRRRRQSQEHASGTESTFTAGTGEKSPSNNIPSRQVSQLSSSGLLKQSPSTQYTRHPRAMIREAPILHRRPLIAEAWVSTKGSIHMLCTFMTKAATATCLCRTTKTIRDSSE